MGPGSKQAFTLKSLYEDRGLMQKIEIITTVSKLTDIGFDIADDWIGAVLVAELTDEYKPMIMSIESSNTKISAEIMKLELLDMNVKTKTNGDRAFYSKNKNFKPKQNTKQVHLGKSAGTSKNYRQSVKNFKCYTCGGRNHKSSECRFNKTGNQPQNESKKLTETVKHAFVAIPNLTNNTTWFIDSGASSHMTLHGCNRRKHSADDIVIADNTRIKIDSVANLSVLKMVEKGNTVIFDKQGCTVYSNDGDVLANTSETNDEHSPAAEENIEASVINTPDNNQTNVSDFVLDNDEQESECEHSTFDADCIPTCNVPTGRIPLRRSSRQVRARQFEDFLTYSPELPDDRKSIQSKWILKAKKDTDGKVVKYKSSTSRKRLFTKIRN
ncbi:hypothetical protein Trydic_g12882 [Trypoxylus dichotomus]